MSKKEKTKTEAAAEKAAAQKDATEPSPVPPSLETTEEAEEDPFDFGGLPRRDLKKNLGCG